MNKTIFNRLCVIFMNSILELERSWCYIRVRFHWLHVTRVGQKAKLCICKNVVQFCVKIYGIYEINT